MGQNAGFDGQSRQTDGQDAQTTDEQVSVYMKDNNVLMRRIQIEGD